MSIVSFDEDLPISFLLKGLNNFFNYNSDNGSNYYNTGGFKPDECIRELKTDER